MDLENAEFSISELLEQVSDVLCFRAQAKSLRFYVIIDPSIPVRIIGDSARLKQVQSISYFKILILIPFRPHSGSRQSGRKCNQIYIRRPR